MDQFFLTVLIAFGFFFFAICLLAVGWLITGQIRFKGSRCGQLPKRKDKGCGTDQTCEICRPPKEEEDS